MKKLGLLKDNYAIKHREDWQGPMFTGMAKYLYETDEQLRFCVDAIADFARSGAGCSGGNHGSRYPPRDYQSRGPSLL